MQTINRSAHTSNFTVFSNELITNSLPAIAYRVLCYMLSRPPHWKKNNADIAKKLSLSAYAVKQALRQIRLAGYAIREKFKDGYSRWFFFDTPHVQEATRSATNPAIKPSVENPTMEFRPLLVNKEKLLKKEKQQPTAITPSTQAPIEEQMVVVSSEDLIYPSQLTEPQKKAAKHIIKKVKQPELQQPVLFALAYAIANGTVKSAPAYLQGLVTRANNGTFEPVGTSSEVNSNKPIIPLWKGHKATPPIDNASYFADLLNRFGSKAAAAIPAQM